MRRAIRPAQTGRKAKTMNTTQAVPMTYLDITLPNGKTAKATIYTDGTVSQGAAVWTAAQWEIGRAKLVAAGAKIIETAV
jgi:hypothetical protein